jgi:hypothetical protein
MGNSTYTKWANAGLKGLKNFWNNDGSNETITQITMSACVCADLDKRHNKTITQVLQGFAWAYGCATHEISFEKYLDSGYFDENFLKKVLTKCKEYGIINM